MLRCTGREAVESAIRSMSTVWESDCGVMAFVYSVLLTRWACRDKVRLNPHPLAPWSVL